MIEKFQKIFHFLIFVSQKPAFIHRENLGLYNYKSAHSRPEKPFVQKFGHYALKCQKAYFYYQSFA